MAAALTLVDKWHDTKRIHYIGSVVFSGNYATGGELLNLRAVLGGARDPMWVEALGKAGYVYAWDYVNLKLMVYYADNNNAADGPLIEIPAAAYPAGVTGDVIRLYAMGRMV